MSEEAKAKAVMNGLAEAEPIECRGRNGWFAFNHYHVWPAEDSITVDLFSKQVGGMPPIVIMGNRLLMIELFESILKELKGNDRAA